MGIWRRRPLFTWASVLMGSALAAFFLAAQVKSALSLLCLAAVLLFIVLGITKRLSPRRVVYAVVLLVTIAAVLIQSLLVFDKKEADVAVLSGQVCDVTATVKEHRGSGGHMSTYTLSVSSINGDGVELDALLTCYYVSDLRPGQVISLRATALTLEEAVGDIYEEYVLLGDGIFMGLLSEYETDYAVLSEEADSLSAKIASHRRTLAARMELAFGEDAAGLPAALLLGERGNIQADTRRDFARTGVSHLLAISGLHMTLLFGILEFILRLVRIPPRVRAVLLGVASAGYLLYLGFPPSATRAVVMLGMTYLSTLCASRADPLTSLGLAGAGILIFSPTSVADVGFWMSFSTTFGLLTLMGRTSQKSMPTEEIKQKSPLLWRLARKGLGKLAGGLGAGIAAVTCSLWVTAPIMGEAGLLSSPMTILFTPVVGLILVTAPLSMLAGASPAGEFLSMITSRASALIDELCTAAANPSWTVISLRHPAVMVTAVLMILGTLLLLGLRLRRRWLTLTPMLAGWIIIGAFLGMQYAQDNTQLDVTYLIPSTASEMLVITRGQEAVICDLSNGSRSSLLTAAEQASDQGATEISAVVLTHYHSRTSGALGHLFESETVRALWIPVPTNEEDYGFMRACLEKAEQAGVEAVIYTEEKDLKIFGSSTLSISLSSLKRSVQPVLLVTLEAPSETLVFCGGGVFESALSDKATALISDSQTSTVILGKHGPVIKASFPCTFGEHIESIYFNDASVAAHLPPEQYPEHEVDMIIGQGRLQME